ncbi:MAG: hypothetical protein AB7E42_03325 [Anaerotignaceae bacterium]
MSEIEQAIERLLTNELCPCVPEDIKTAKLAVQSLQEKLEREEGFEFESLRRDREDRCKHRCCNICDRLRQEKAERENLQEECRYCNDTSFKQLGKYVDSTEGSEILEINHYCINCGRKLVEE